MSEKRVLRNVSRVSVETVYNGRVYKIKPKGTLTLDNGGRDEFAADNLLMRYKFLIDITKQLESPVKAKAVRKSTGKRTLKGGKK